MWSGDYMIRDLVYDHGGVLLQVQFLLVLSYNCGLTCLKLTCDNVRKLWWFFNNTMYIYI
jgi:hypothetical protein